MESEKQKGKESLKCYNCGRLQEELKNSIEHKNRLNDKLNNLIKSNGKWDLIYMEWGFKAHEKGYNLEKAKEKFKEIR